MKYYRNSTNYVPTCIAHTALTIDNIKEILDQTWQYRAKWKYIGIELGIDTGTLDAIDKDHKKADDCLTNVIKIWLRNISPRPTKRALTRALESPLVAVSTSPVNEGIVVMFTIIFILAIF